MIKTIKIELLFEKMVLMMKSISITNTKRYRTYIFHCPLDGKRFNRTYFRMMTRVPIGAILYSLLTLERGMFTHPWEPLYL